MEAWKPILEAIGLSDRVFLPVGLFLSGVLVCYLLLGNRLALAGTLRFFRARRGLRWMTGFLVVALGVYEYNPIHYLFSDIVLDHIEPQIVSVAWLFARGEPLYHAIASPLHYSVIYGPGVYMIPALTMKLFGPSLFAAKLIPLLCVIFFPLVLFGIGRKLKRSYAPLFFGIGLVLAEFLVFHWYALWIRAEPTLLFVSGLALLAALSDQRTRAIAGMGALLGLAFALKITSPVYLLPAMGLLLKRHGFRAFLLAGISGVILGGLPYLLPNVSATHYLEYLEVGKQAHPLDDFYVSNVPAWAAFLALPFLLLLSLKEDPWKFLVQERLYFGSLLLSVLVATYAGMVEGGGMYHLLPLLPAFFYAGLSAWDPAEFRKKLSRNTLRVASVLIAFTIAIGARAAVNEGHLIELMKTQLRYGDVTSDIQSFLAAHPGKTVEVGYGEDYRPSLYRFVPVLAGNPYLIDEGAWMGMQNAGFGMPKSTLAEFEACRPKVWLIPRGRKPFYLRSFHFGQAQIFDNAIREVFHSNYQLQGQTRYFDVWSCKQDS